MSANLLLSLPPEPSSRGDDADVQSILAQLSDFDLVIWSDNSLDDRALRHAQRVVRADAAPAWAAFQRQAPAAAARLHTVEYTRDAARLSRLLGLCDLMVFPSLYEGTPNAVLEAMAAEGLDVLDDRCVGDLAAFRRHELAAALNRVRGLRIRTLAP